MLYEGYKIEDSYLADHVGLSVWSRDLVTPTYNLDFTKVHR